MKKTLLAAFLYCIHLTGFSAVILQYHHVSGSTPKSTSISPEQFEVHLKYLQDHNFTVVPLSQLMSNIKKQQPLKDKTVVITFDDAYIDILTQAKPLLDKYHYPYTIYINPGIINRNEHRKKSLYLSWSQLKTMAEEGVIMANHGFEHDSMIRITDGLTETEWLTKQTELLLNAERIIKEKTGQSWRYFAYPYGEYNLAVQHWITEHDFIAFSQQSGAIGIHTDLTSIPRFPASMPYDKMLGLRDKLHSLPFNIQLQGEQTDTIFEYKQAKRVTFTVKTEDFYKAGLNCYISGLGKQKIEWLGDSRFTINFTGDLPVGRVRANCTAASISKPGRYYWYSKPWFILKPDGKWYHL